MAGRDPEIDAREAATTALVNAQLKDLPAELRTRVQGVIGQAIGRIVAKEREKSVSLALRT